MRTKYLLPLTVLVLLVIATSACASLFRPVSGENNPSAQQTAVMATVQAVLTQNAFQTLVAQATQQSQATATPEPTATQPQATVVTPTATSIPPTVTATPVPTPCNWASFVKDVTVPDGTEFSSGQQFTKTWRLKNIGTCTWTTSYDLVFVSGDAMSGPAAVDFQTNVRPGETIDLSVNLVAPNDEGNYKGFWMLRDDSGKLFGIGSNAKDAFFVSIKVNGFSSDTVPTPIYPLDFTASICQATWSSNAGKVELPCVNYTQSQSQWASVLMNPKFENGSQENERTIWMHLANANDWMVGAYPAQAIQSGDHIITWVGCLYGSTNCKAVLSVDYRIGSDPIQNLGKWTETYDGNMTKIDIDLSQFAGKNLTFILGVENKNSSGSLNLFWFVPSVQHTSASS